MEFVEERPHCTNSEARTPKSRLLGPMVHGTEVGEVIRSDFHLIGTGGGALRDNGVDGEASKFLLVLVEDVVGYTW